MLPFLRHGDLVHVRPLPAAAVRVGDVICYAPSPGRLHLHRVVARDERGFVTRGDALPYVEDVPADFNKVLEESRKNFPPAKNAKK